MQIKYVHSFLLILLTFCTVGLTAQISVSNSTFPEIGDTLTTRQITNLDNFDLGDDGADKFWNFENAQLGPRNSILYLDPSMGNAGANFPDAELMASQGGISEIYYDVFNNRIDELGRGGQDFGFGDIDIPLRYEKNPVFRRSPIDFGDVNDNQSIASIRESKDILPDSILNLLGTFANLIDSLRIDLDITNSASVDAWGTINIPGGSYDVLREKVNTTQNVRLFFKTPFSGWSEAGSELLVLLGPAAAFFGEQIFTNYNFYSATEKEIIASFTTDNMNVLISGVVKAHPVSVSTKKLTYTANEINAYPNPSFGPITFDVGAFGNGEYILTVYNIVGKQIINDSFEVSNNDGYNANYSHLRKGTYIYTIHDDKGEKLATKRFIILKP